MDSASGTSFTGPTASARSTSGPSGPRTLMFFKGCPRPVGCTILLKGAPQAELTAVKRVMQFAVYSAHRLRLETAFLADEFASAVAATLGLDEVAAVPPKPAAAVLGPAGTVAVAYPSPAPGGAAAPASADQDSSNPAAQTGAAAKASQAASLADGSAPEVATAPASPPPPSVVSQSASVPTLPLTTTPPPAAEQASAPPAVAPPPAIWALALERASPLALASALGIAASSCPQAVGATTPPMPLAEPAEGSSAAAAAALVAPSAVRDLSDATPLGLSQPSPLKGDDAVPSTEDPADVSVAGCSMALASGNAIPCAHFQCWDPTHQFALLWTAAERMWTPQTCCAQGLRCALQLK